MPKKLTRLPLASDGEAGLQTLARAFGEANTLRHVLWLRDRRHEGVRTITPFLNALAVAICHDQGPDIESSRVDAARTLGYAPKRVQNFYRCVTAGLAADPIKVTSGAATRLTRLPTEEDGIDGLRKLVDAYGKVNVFKFIQYMRDWTNDTATRFRGQLALRLVDAEREADPTLDFFAARALAAKKAGFVGNNQLPNFHHYVDEGLEAVNRTAL